MNSTRIAFFDIAKFIAMMMVILGHFGVPDINRFVFTFHIPLFFLISGYFFHPYEKTFSLLKIKARQLLIPYLFTMVSVIFIYILREISNKETFFNIAKGIGDHIIGYLYGSGYIDTVFGHYIEIVGPIWFCLALFGNFILLNCILKTKYPLFYVFLCFVIGYWSSQYVWLPLSIQSSLTSLFFFYLGYQAKLYNILNKTPCVSHILPLLCIWGIGLSYGGQFLIVQNYSVSLISDITVALSACYLVVLYCQWLENNSSSAKIMAFLGKYTIVMLCFHSIDVNIMPWNEYFKTPNTSGTVIFIKVLITFVKFLFPIFGAVLVSKSSVLKRFFALKY